MGACLTRSSTARVSRALCSGKTTAELMKIREMAFLAYLPEREGGWTTWKEWRDVLSGGGRSSLSFLPHPRL
ncbi:hypothetical protein C8J57DRAFT_1310415 [Mycena rebaudengoi]|nr:hypothetical protein C8J57DRAFT_1310415 [Mycena rebaudengoi]